MKCLVRYFPIWIYFCLPSHGDQKIAYSRQQTNWRRKFSTFNFRVTNEFLENGSFSLPERIRSQIKSTISSPSFFYDNRRLVNLMEEREAFYLHKISRRSFLSLFPGILIAYFICGSQQRALNFFFFPPLHAAGKIYTHALYCMWWISDKQLPPPAPG